jgi:hypothetical protein
VVCRSSNELQFVRCDRWWSVEAPMSYSLLGVMVGGL